VRRRRPGRRAHHQASRLTILETERLILRPFRADDLDPLFAILGDPGTMRFYPRPYTRDEVRGWIDRNRERFDQTGRGLWAIVLKESKDVVGDCGVTDQEVDDVIEAEIGWHVERSRWREGIATEAAVAHRNRAFGELDLDHLVSLIRPENVASCRVAEKLGMTVEKETDRAGLRHLVYSLTAP
jgi:[ribosomal protein S5]-alanine N-acetyltransferase